MGMFDYVMTYDEDEPIEWQTKSAINVLNRYHIIDERLYVDKVHKPYLLPHLEEDLQTYYKAYLRSTKMSEMLQMSRNESVLAFKEKIPLDAMGVMTIYTKERDRLYVWDYDGSMHMEESEKEYPTLGGLYLNHDFEALKAFEERAAEWDEEHLEYHVALFEDRVLSLREAEE